MARGWGALVTAATALAFAEAARIEKARVPGGQRAVAAVAPQRDLRCAIPFALAGAWTAYLVALLVYAAASFFVVQHVRHFGRRVDAKLTEIR